MPAWTQAVFPGGKFEQLRNVIFTLDSFDHQMKRLQGGPFITELVGHYDAVEGNTMVPANRKVFMYSAHDTTVSYVLNTLGVYDGLAPPYASVVMFELYDLNGWHVKISWRNDTTRPPHVLTIPGCQQLCPLQKFKKLTDSVRPADWTEECQLETSAYSWRDTWLQTVLPCISVAIVMMAVYNGIMLRWGRLRKYRKGYDEL